MLLVYTTLASCPLTYALHFMDLWRSTLLWYFLSFL